jgi:hypothetical protein
MMIDIRELLAEAEQNLMAALGAIRSCRTALDPTYSRPPKWDATGHEISVGQAITLVEHLTGRPVDASTITRWLNRYPHLGYRRAGGRWVVYAERMIGFIRTHTTRRK